MKKCFKWGKEKQITDFYKHPRMLDGHLGKCKECAKLDVQQNYRKNIDNFREYEKQRNKKEERIRQRLDSQGRRRHNRPETYRAYMAVRNALNTGRLQKTPCVLCGKKTVEAHHPNYNKPLDVVWLCFECHRMIHGNGNKFLQYQNNQVRKSA